MAYKSLMPGEFQELGGSQWGKWKPSIQSLSMEPFYVYNEYSSTLNYIYNQ